MAGRFAAALLCFLVLATGASAQSADPERATLAQRVVELIWTPSTRDRDVEVIVRGMQGMVSMTAAFSGFAPSFDSQQLDRSFHAGAEAALSQERSQLAQAASANMSTEQLRAAVDFYSSRSGGAAIRARVRYRERIGALIRRAARGQEVQVPEYTPSGAERAFLESDAGRALAVAFATAPPSSDTRQSAFELAEADYCQRAACGEDHHEFFRRMHISVNTGRARGERAIWGETAVDVFPGEQTAALARAACAGDSDTVARLAAEAADVNVVGGEVYGDWGMQGMTPLMWAIDCGNVRGIEALLVAGADPNGAEPHGGTAVTIAARHQNPEILGLLLRNGGNPNAHRRDETALQIALYAQSSFEVYNLPPEVVAANWNTLLEAGADPDFVAPGGEPLVLVAAQWNRWDAVEWLLNRGWDGDWVHLGRILETSEENTSRELIPPSRDRVRAVLVERGVRFPVGGLMDLEQDTRGHYIQPPEN